MASCFLSSRALGSHFGFVAAINAALIGLVMGSFTDWWYVDRRKKRAEVLQVLQVLAGEPSMAWRDTELPGIW